MIDAPTIGERYRKATTSSKLKVEAIRSGDPDLLIAAGWSDSLGIMLYRLAGEFDQVSVDVKRAQSLTDAILVMNHLKTLTPARIALVNFASDAAPRWGMPIDPNVCAVLVGRALNAWLDPNCPRCGGTGTIGGYDGKVANICRKCAGSGKSRHNLGHTEAERRFTERLLSVMDAKMHEADAILRKYLKSA